MSVTAISIDRSKRILTLVKKSSWSCFLLILHEELIFVRIPRLYFTQKKCHSFIVRLSKEEAEDQIPRFHRQAFWIFPFKFVM